MKRDAKNTAHNPNEHPQTMRKIQKVTFNRSRKSKACKNGGRGGEINGRSGRASTRQEIPRHVGARVHLLLHATMKVVQSEQAALG